MNKFGTFDQRGAFLIEVTIGGALLIGIAMAGASFFKTRIKDQDYLEKLQEVNTFHTVLTKTLQNSGNCNATFKDYSGKTTVPGTASGDIKRIFLCASNCDENSTALSANRVATPWLTEATAKPTDGTQWITGTTTSLNNRTRNWQIKDFGMELVSSSGRGTLNVLYELYPGRSDSRKVTKSISIYLKFTPPIPGVPPLPDIPPKFVSCGSEKESSLRSALQEMCGTLTTATNAGGGTFFTRWDHVSQRCVTIPIPACGVNLAIGGLDQGGVARCQSLTKGANLSNLYQPITQNCSGGLAPQLTIDSLGKLRITCI